MIQIRVQGTRSGHAHRSRACDTGGWAPRVEDLPPLAVNIASGPRVSGAQHIILQGASCVTCTPPPRPIPCPCRLPGLFWACPATRGGSKASCQSLDSLRVSQSIVSLRHCIGSKGIGSKAVMSHFADNPLLVCEFGMEVLFSIPNSPTFYN